MRRPVHVLLSLALLGLTAGSVPAAQYDAVDLPDTPAGRNLAAFIETFNSGDSSRWRAFVIEQYSPEQGDSAAKVGGRFNLFEMVYNDIGPITPFVIEESDDYRISVITQSAESGPFEFQNFTYQVDSLPPHKWDLMSVRPADDPFEVLPEGDLSDERIAAWVDSVAGAMAGRGDYSGAVLLAKGGKPFYKRAFGEANKRYGVPNEIDTKFNLGSMNKMFTGVAVAQLAQQGKLKFTDRIIDHWPDYPDPAIGRKVTIHHLLTHTSGMTSYWQELFDTSFWEVRTVAGYFSLIKGKELAFEPGSEWQYSNSGPIVLGMLIEKITGMSYYDYVRENIYEPAGMVNSGCFEVDVPEPNLAIGYTQQDVFGNETNGWYANFFMHAVKGGPAGGGYSTVDDLLAFANALRDHKLLNEAYTDTVITGKSDMGPDMKYAYLFGDRNLDGHRIVGHNGGAPGISAELDIYWDDEYTVAVLSNYDGAAGHLNGKIRKLLTR